MWKPTVFVDLEDPRVVSSVLSAELAQLSPLSHSRKRLQEPNNENTSTWPISCLNNGKIKNILNWDHFGKDIHIGTLHYHVSFNDEFNSYAPM